MNTSIRRAHLLGLLAVGCLLPSVGGCAAGTGADDGKADSNEESGSDGSEASEDGSSEGEPEPECTPLAEAPMFDDRLIWERAYYEGIGGSFDPPVASPAGGIVVTGSSVLPGLSSIDSDGELQWSIEWPGGAEIEAVAGDPQYDFAVVGREGGQNVLWRVSVDGEITSTSELGPVHTPGPNIDECDDSYEAQGVAVDNAGRVLVSSERRNPISYEPECGSCDYDSRQHFRVVEGEPGFSQNGADYVRFLFGPEREFIYNGDSGDQLVKLDVDGMEEWELDMDGNRGFAAMPSGDIVVSALVDDGGGSAAVYLFGPDGTERWSENLGTCTEPGWVAADGAEFIYMGGRYDEPESISLHWVRKFDAEGEVIWLHKFAADVGVRGGVVDENGDLIVVGYVGPGTNPWAAKLAG